MASLLDLGKKIEEIRAAVDMVEVRGSQNRNLLNYAYRQCNEAIKLINDAVQQVTKSPPSEGENKAGEENGEHD